MVIFTTDSDCIYRIIQVIPFTYIIHGEH